MTETKFKTDVCIIGAGPVGLSAVFQCGMLGLKCHVVDALPDIGGQCTALYPEKPIYDIPAYPEIPAGGLIDALAKQAEPFKPVYHLGQSVVSLMQDTALDYHVVTDQGQEIIARVVIIAAGPGAFGPNKPPLDDLCLYENTSVHYMVRNKSCFEGQTLMIAGGGDSAVDWAISLSDIAKKIYFVHRRDKFRAAPDTVAKLEALFDTDKIESCIPSQLKSVSGDAPYLKTVQIADMQGVTRDIEVDHLLCFYGLKQDLGAIRDWDLDIEGFHIKIDPTTALTSRAGIYAIGDVATYPNKLKLIMTGFAEGAQAAHHAYSYIHPDQALHFEYSNAQNLHTVTSLDMNMAALDQAPSQPVKLSEIIWNDRTDKTSKKFHSAASLTHNISPMPARTEGTHGSTQHSLHTALSHAHTPETGPKMSSLSALKQDQQTRQGLPKTGHQNVVSPMFLTLQEASADLKGSSSAPKPIASIPSDTPEVPADLPMKMMQALDKYQHMRKQNIN